MISIYFRRLAIMIRAETGESVQEVLEKMAKTLHSGVVEFDQRLCPLCASQQVVTESTKTSEVEIVRYHKCGFCGLRFKSLEKLPVKNPPELAQTTKKPHIRNKRR